ncbi:hypothetical protein DER45DRAFT_605913 [Fusarium avenaceum]|nr:hypothetical protein DER45DRAFT_605913 [Fusarium avenaceum]
MSTVDYRSLARGETTKRLIVQLIHEKLVSRWMTLPIRDSFCLSKHLRPSDFGVPVILYHDGTEPTEDDPGSIFEFATAWFKCDEQTKSNMVEELRSASKMLEKWMVLDSDAPMLNINSSLLDWDRCLVLHRTCFASSLRSPETPDGIPGPLNPGLSFVAVPRPSARLFGPFEKLLEPLLHLVGVLSPYDKDGYAVIPCLEKYLPAVLDHFPTAQLIETVTGRAFSQASAEAVSVPGYIYDLKLPPPSLITSGFRFTPYWSVASAPVMASLLRKLIPQELWLFGEIAAVTGIQQDTTDPHYMACTLRENLESKAEENDDSLILVAALLERPQGGKSTYAEMLFGLETAEDKLIWLRRYIRKLLKLSLEPLVRHGVGLSLNAQNTVVRICHRTKAVKGFAIRGLSGVRLHGPTLQDQGFDLTSLEATITQDVHEVWDSVHLSLVQNHIGLLLESLGLELHGWQIVSFELERALQAEVGSMEQSIFRHFVKETMAFESPFKMRLMASVKTPHEIVYQQIPNVLWKKSPWLRQISLAATKSANALVQPEQADKQTRMSEAEAMKQALLRNTQEYGDLPKVAKRLNPHPFVLPNDFLVNLEQFHEALALAIDNIVDRWWKDDDANLPSRMPLEPRVEKLLRWVAQGSEEGKIKPYKGNQGNLRPDILVPDTGIHASPQFKVCEINGRFPIAFLHYAAIAYQALSESTWNDPLLRPAADHKKLFDSFFQLFDPTTPIHFVVEPAEVPPDSPLFGLVEQQTGFRPRSVCSSSFRVVPCDKSWTGFDLYCELLALEPVMVREIARRCVNDLRSVFIAHDKRILGIIHQELHDLVHKHKVITEGQARILKEGIIPTILPESPELQSLIEDASRDPAIKDKYILKPFRLARGSGIRLGKTLSSEEWQLTLESMRKTDFDSLMTQYLLQPILPLQSVEWFWTEERQVVKSGMVGLYFSVNGRFVGLGTWRVADVSESIISSSSMDTTSCVAVAYYD